MNGNAELEKLFPNLRSAAYSITSDPSWRYNCFAFALGIVEWWSPAPGGYYWPRGVPRGQHIKNIVLLYEKEGFSICDDSSLEEGFEKLALYADRNECTHVARQQSDGKWLSKLAQDHDIEHETLDSLVGIEFGNVARFMKRQKSAA